MDYNLFNQPAFHNTIQNNESEQAICNASALSQEERVHEVFKFLKSAAWFEVHAMIPDMSEVSLKRSISNLSNKGKLVKLTDKGLMKLSPANKPCHIYQLTIK